METEQPQPLLGLAKAFAGLSFTNQDDKVWLEGRFAMFKDLLEESWVVQEWIARGEAKGEAKGNIETARKLFLGMFQLRFPNIDIASNSLTSIQDASFWEDLTLKAGVAQTPEGILEALDDKKLSQQPSSSQEDGLA